VHTVVSSYINTLKDHPDLIRLILLEFSGGAKNIPGIISENLMRSFGDLPPFIFNTFREAVRRKEIRPMEPVHLFINIVGMCAGSFIAQPILTAVHRKFLGKDIVFNNRFYKKRIDAITGMTCEGLCIRKRGAR
jgi:hypothetical protein